MYFYTLAEALREYPAGSVASAVEKDGCYCIDDYGRSVKSNEKSKAEILEIISSFYKSGLEWIKFATEDELESAERSPEYWMLDFPSEHPAWGYGWDKDKVPKFAIESSKKSLTSEELRLLIIREHKTLKAQGVKDYTKRVAAKYELTTVRIRQIISGKKAPNQTSRSGR